MLKALWQKRQISELLKTRTQRLQDMDNFPSHLTRSQQRQETMEWFIKEKTAILNRASPWRVWLIEHWCKYHEHRWAKKEAALERYIIYRTGYVLSGRRLETGWPHYPAFAPEQELVDAFYRHYDEAASKRRKWRSRIGIYS